jgi:threonine dehydratase
MNSSIKIQDPLMVEQAHTRLKSFLHQTPILQSEYLNNLLGHEIHFKVDSLQKTGSFKVRGALNHLLARKSSGVQYR